MGWLEDLFRGNGGYNPGMGKTGQINLDTVMPKGADRYAAWSREAPPRSVPLPGLGSLDQVSNDLLAGLRGQQSSGALYPSTLGQSSGRALPSISDLPR